MKKSVISIMGMCFSIAAIICGIFLLLSKPDEYDLNMHYPYIAYGEDSGFATFGSDFYTYVNNNAAQAASSSDRALRNQHEIAKQIQSVEGSICMAGGMLLMTFGGIGFCVFGLINGNDKTKSNNDEQSAEHCLPQSAIKENKT